MNDISTRRRGRRWSRLVAAPVGVVALVGLAACGTSTDTTAAASDAGTSTGAPAAQGSGGEPSDSAMAAYTNCLSENGVTLPERPTRGGGAPDGSGGTPPSGAPAAPEDGGRDGGPGGGPGGPGGTPGEAPEGVGADTWAAAQEACAALAPAPPDAAGTSSGT